MSIEANPGPDPGRAGGGSSLALLAAAPPRRSAPTAFAATTPIDPRARAGHAARRAAAHVPVRPDDDPARPEPHRRRPPARAAERQRLDRRLPARASSTPPTARRRRSPRCTCTTRSGSSALKPTFAAGEEKTYINAPSGYGWRYTTKQFLVINHMIHDLSASPKKVYITYTMWFIPDTAPEAAGHQGDLDAVDGRPGRQGLPGVRRAARLGHRRHAHLPRPGPERVRARAGAQPLGRRPRRDARDDRRAPAPGRAVDRPPHHARRRDETPVPLARELLRTRRRGLVGRVDERDRPGLEGRDQEGRRHLDDARRTTRRAPRGTRSWGSWSSASRTAPDGGVDPFTADVDQTDYLTHGRLPENVDDGVRRAEPRASATRCACAAARSCDRVTIRNFAFDQGDLTSRGTRGRPATVRAGAAADVRQPRRAADDPLPHDHRVPGAVQPHRRHRLPARRRAHDLRLRRARASARRSAAASTRPATGDTAPITAAKPLAAPAGALQRRARARQGRLERVRRRGDLEDAEDPASPALYTYFCRIHPFMRGAFRVVPKSRARGRDLTCRPEGRVADWTNSRWKSAVHRL